jgi:hypothetical protein
MRAPLAFGIPAFEQIDGADPPTFESQPSYLERLGLLTDGERAQLGPEAFEPDVLAADSE